MHVDAETLQEGVAGRCELEEGPSLAVETARRLACEASVVSIVENAQGEPLNIGRKSRTIPPAIRRALNARDRGCRFPRMLKHAVRRCPSRAALVERRRDEAVEPGAALSLPPSASARRPG